MSHDSDSASDRIDAFAAAIDEFDVDRHSDDVDVRVAVGAGGFRVDLADLFATAAEHGLVATDGWVGGQGVASLRFEPVERVAGVRRDDDAA